jgi:hypothetical protein
VKKCFLNNFTSRITAKNIKAAIVIFATFLCVRWASMILSSESDSIESWESWSRFGVKLVIVGVAGEGTEFLAEELTEKFEIFKKHKAWFNFAERIFWILVCVGLVLELYAGNIVTELSDTKISDSDRNAKVADVRASKANERAKSNELAVAVLTNKNLSLSIELEGLRSNNLALEEQMRSRLIESSKPTARLKEFSRVNAVIISAAGGDCPNTANQIGEILRSANWNVSGIRTDKAAPPGISVGLSSTNNSLDMGYWAMEFSRDAGKSPAHNGCVAIVDELNRQNVAAKIDDMMYFGTSIRFEGVVIFVGPRPDQLTAQIFSLENESRTLGRHLDEIDAAESSLLRFSGTKSWNARLNLDLQGLMSQESQLKKIRNDTEEKISALGDTQFNQANPGTSANKLSIINVGSGPSLPSIVGPDTGFFNLGYEILP